MLIVSHRIYREPMREHLHHITLRHWDKSMRVLGARALRELIQQGGPGDIDDAVEREVCLDSTIMLITRSPHYPRWTLTAYTEPWSPCVKSRRFSAKTMLRFVICGLQC